MSVLLFFKTVYCGENICYDKKKNVVFLAFETLYIYKGVMAMDRLLIYSWYEQYKTGIYRYALSVTKDAYMAEDILHDVFVKLLSGKYRVAPENAQAWLYRVARNLCYDQLRKIKPESLETMRQISGPDPYAYIELLEPLSGKDREIVTLKIVGGLTHQQIGAVLGISARAAQKRYERAIAILRNEEEAYGTKAT